MTSHLPATTGHSTHLATQRTPPTITIAFTGRPHQSLHLNFVYAPIRQETPMLQDQQPDVEQTAEADTGAEINQAGRDQINDSIVINGNGTNIIQGDNPGGIHQVFN